MGWRLCHWCLRAESVWENGSEWAYDRGLGDKKEELVDWKSGPLVSLQAVFLVIPCKEALLWHQNHILITHSFYFYLYYSICVRPLLSKQCTVHHMVWDKFLHCGLVNSEVKRPFLMNYPQVYLLLHPLGWCPAEPEKQARCRAVSGSCL